MAEERLSSRQIPESAALCDELRVDNTVSMIPLLTSQEPSHHRKQHVY